MKTERETLCHTLKHWFEVRRDRTAYVFLGDGERESGRLTYGELWERSVNVAGALQQRLHRGERALLLYSDGLEFIVGFMGCLIARVVPVPAYPPRKNRRVDVCSAIARDCNAQLVLTASSDAKGLASTLATDATLAQLPLIASDAVVPPTPVQEIELPCATDVAFVQYTSGSTGNPKGVIVAHSNLVNNEKAVEESFGHDDDCVFVGWLPLFHDMGLIGNVLQPLYLGIPCHLMPPSAFLQKPIRWLRAISRYRATTSGAPNFAYELCAQKIREEEKTELDLSCWRVAYNGSEPVRAETLARFTNAFAPYGFRGGAHYPCYGMAETTLFLTGGERGALRTVVADVRKLEQNIVERTSSQRFGCEFVSCGFAWQGNEVRIVDPTTGELAAPRTIGEIWATGPSIAQGYWNSAHLTQERFHARIPGDERRWYRTGDLGFVEDNDLYVTGRLKDLIIIRGRNHYPQDIELTAERSHPAIAPGRVAAFSVTEDVHEQLVIIVEIDFSARATADVEEVIAAVRSMIASQHELTAKDIVTVRPSTLPITSSGKVQRSRCRQLYLTRELVYFQARHITSKQDASQASEL